MAKALGGVGAWAEEAEREEAEQKKQAEAEAEAEASRKKQQAETEAAAAVGKSRRKKNPTYSISEVTTGQYVGPGGRSRVLPDARVFPFADRNKVPDQTLSGRAGAGFDPRSQEFDRKREPLPAPASRADQVDDWGFVKRATAVASSSERPGIPSQDGKRSVESSSLPPPEETRVAELVQQQVRVRSDPFAGARTREQVLAEREKEGLLCKDKVSEKDKMGIVSGAEKASNVVEEEVIVEEKSRSSTSSRPPTPRGPELEPQGAARKKKENIFGVGKPREVLLEERGVDYRKIDLELERRPVVRPESEKERELKEEINKLKMLVKNAIEGDRVKYVEGSGQVLDKEHADNLQAQLNQKESELQELTLGLDDMVRFPQKHVDRPSSRSGHSDHSGKLFSGPERSDISRGFNPERLGSLSLSGDITGEYDGERSSLSSRDRDMSRRFEPERRGGMVRGSGRRSSALDRPGPRPGYNDFFQGNGSERVRSNTGPFNFNRGHPSERLDSRFQRNNTSRGYDSERPSSSSWQSDPRGYGPEMSGSGSWHDDTTAHESERPGTGSWQGDTQWHEPAGSRPNSRRSDTHRGLVIERGISLPAREKHSRGGSDFDRSGSFAGYNERKRDVFDRLGPMPAQRETPRRFVLERLGARPSSVDTHTHQDLDAIDWPVGNDDSRRHHEVQSSYTVHESETMEPWPTQEDNRRSYDSYRGSERSRNDQFVYNEGNYGDDFSSRRNYRQQDYGRRGNYALQDRFSQGRGVHVNHR
ncbi:hypothetical protein SUGI_0736890 [Cryptomeria japonica]|nr:hypothetical protein SUGI_0736890 [Cryptomeria japonica]